MSANINNLQDLEYADDDQHQMPWDGTSEDIDLDAEYVPPDDDEDEDEDEESGDVWADVEQEDPLVSTAAELLAESQAASEQGGIYATQMFSLGTGQRGLLQLLLRAGYGNTGTRARRQRVESPPSDPEDDIEPLGQWSRTKSGYRDPVHPTLDGVRLLRSGEYGRVGPIRGQYKTDPERPNQPCLRREARQSLTAILRQRQMSTRRAYRDDLARHLVPNSHGTTVATYSSNAYSGQFSADSSFYYTCCQDWRLHIYDTTVAPRADGIRYGDLDHSTTMKVRKTVDARPGRWTITDSHLSPDNERLIYSSITPTVYMVNLNDPADDQTPIDFGDGRRREQRHYDWDGGQNFGLYSCRFSTDGKEIVVASGSGYLMVYDLTADKRSVKILAHADDVNSCCWADTASGNVLVSASDDASLKVWDRRSLGASRKPSGVLIGHTEGITHVSPKGDGRYVISNGKDQVLRLWDLRNMRSSNDWNTDSANQYRSSTYDYRDNSYPRPRYRSHPKDCSVMQYRGHKVLRTLIRCHFSPTETTGNSYIASGSSDGMIHIWSLDGSVVQVLDRSKTLPISFDPSAADPPMSPSRPRPAYSVQECCVRDVAWHSTEPVLMSCAWQSDRYSGTDSSTVARHEWKGFGKHSMTLEDAVERTRIAPEGLPRIRWERRL